MNNCRKVAAKLCVTSFLLTIPLAIALLDFLYPHASGYSYSFILLSPIIIATCSYFLYMAIPSSIKIVWSINPVISSVMIGLTIYGMYICLTFLYLTAFEDVFSLSSIRGSTGTFIVLYGWVPILLGILYKLKNGKEDA